MFITFSDVSVVVANVLNIFEGAYMVLRYQSTFLEVTEDLPLS